MHSFQQRPAADYAELQEEGGADKAQRQQPRLQFAEVLGVGPDRPPVNFLPLALAAAVLQGCLSPHLYALELFCGAQLALRSVQTSRLSRLYFDRGEFELAALTSYRAGRYAAAAIVLTAFAVLLVAAALLAVVFLQPQHESAFHFVLRYSGT